MNFCPNADSRSREYLKRGIISLKLSKKNSFVRDAVLMTGDRRVEVTVSTAAIRMNGEVVYITAIREKGLERKTL